MMRPRPNQGKQASRLLAARVLFLICTALLASCKQSDDAKNGISGTVAVEGGTADGVTVDVFAKPTYDQNSAWFQAERSATIGFPYNLSAAFDWRTQIPIASVTTGSNGAFNFPDLTDRDYVIVARKPSFGWSKPLQASLRGQPINLGAITLYAELHPANTLTTSETWLSGHHYVLAGGGGRFTINEGVTLTLQPGVVVRVGDGWPIFVRGSLVSEGTEENFITFASDETDTVTTGHWQYIKFEETAESPPSFRFTRFSECGTGILSSTSSATIENCYFVRCENNAAYLTGHGGKKSFKRNIVDAVDSGIRMYGSQGLPVDSVFIENNIFIDCNRYAVFTSVGVGGSIYCNGFYYCGRSDSTGATSGTIYLSDVHDLEVANNAVFKSWYAFNLGSKVDSSVNIHDNWLSNIMTVMYVGVTNERRGASYPTFRFNCMYTISGWFIRIIACIHNSHDIEAHDNYWGTSRTGIESGIQDCSDPPEGAGCGCVNYDPPREVCSSAGLCTE
jgi:hypothetical protein